MAVRGAEERDMTVLSAIGSFMLGFIAGAAVPVVIVICLLIFIYTTWDGH